MCVTRSQRGQSHITPLPKYTSPARSFCSKTRKEHSRKRLGRKIILKRNFGFWDVVLEGAVVRRCFSPRFPTKTSCPFLVSPPNPSRHFLTVYNSSCNFLQCHVTSSLSRNDPAGRNPMLVFTARLQHEMCFCAITV